MVGIDKKLTFEKQKARQCDTLVNVTISGIAVVRSWLSLEGRRVYVENFFL